MAVATYGTKTTAAGVVSLGTTGSASPGEICQATYNITGLGSNFIGADNMLGIDWQSGAINQIRDTLLSQNCTLLYAEVNPDNSTVFAQFTPKTKQASGTVSTSMHMGARIAGVDDVIVWTICIAIVIGLVAWFILDVIPDSVEKLTGVVASSPISATIVYGGMALLGLALYAYITRGNRSGSGGGYDDG